MKVSLVYSDYLDGKKGGEFKHDLCKKCRSNLLNYVEDEKGKRVT